MWQQCKPMKKTNNYYLKNMHHLQIVKCEMNNTQLGNVKDTDVVILTYNKIEYKYNYLKASGSL